MIYPAKVCRLKYFDDYQGPVELKVGDYIQVKGSLEVFAPNTEYSKEEIWD